MQVLDGGIANVAEGSDKTIIIEIIFATIVIDSDCMAVAVEHTPVGMTIVTATIWGADVGIEAGVHVVLTFGILYLLVKRYPAEFVADGVVEFCDIGQLVDGRCVAVHIHLYIVGHARVREVDNLVALCALVVGQGIDEAIDNVALAVLHRDA